MGYTADTKKQGIKSIGSYQLSEQVYFWQVFPNKARNFLYFLWYSYFLQHPSAQWLLFRLSFSHFQIFTYSYPEACPELWHYNFFFLPGFLAALFSHSTLFTAQLLQSSVLLCGPHLPIAYIPSSSNLRLSFTVVITTAAHSRWAIPTQTKCLLHLLLMFPILLHSLLCSSPLPVYPLFLR